MPAPTTPTTQLAAAIRHHRREAGYKRQADLAAALHVNQSTVSAWESGAGRPEPQMMARLNVLTGVPLETYFIDLADAASAGSNLTARYYGSASDLLVCDGSLDVEQESELLAA